MSKLTDTEAQLVKTYSELTSKLLRTRAGNKLWRELYNERRQVLRDLMYHWKLTDERQVAMHLLNGENK